MSDSSTSIPSIDPAPYRNIHAKAEEHKKNGDRLMTLIAFEGQTGEFELRYLFDASGKILQDTIMIMPEWEVESISDVYKAGLNMEREVIDLFGLKFKGVLPGLLMDKDKGIIAPLRKRVSDIKEDKKDG